MSGVRSEAADKQTIIAKVPSEPNVCQNAFARIHIGIEMSQASVSRVERMGSSIRIELR